MKYRTFEADSNSTDSIMDSISNFRADSISISFTPHLVPMNRGILVTAYANLEQKYYDITQKDLDTILQDFYSDKFFVRVLESGLPPETRWVNGSNFCDVSVRLDTRNKRIIMMSALDNLIKGAAGAAVQNLNLAFGFKESQALESPALFP